MSAAQRRYINDLLRERAIPLAWRTKVNVLLEDPELPGAKVSEIIDALKDRPYADHAKGEDLTPSESVTCPYELGGEVYALPIGTMLAAGRLNATITRPAGEHITIFARAMAKDDESGKWEQRPFDEAMCVFIRAGRDFFEKKIATYYPAGQQFRPAGGADPERVAAAIELFRHVAGHGGIDGRLTVAGECGHCGRELTRPESVQRGLGPVCSGDGYQKDEHHQTTLEAV